MRAVTFTNPGEIDTTALTTFGISVKEGENPIGHFGTGLKYAIAILMRSGCKVTIWRGEEMLLLGTREVEVRGQKFTVLTLDDEQLGFTTDVGKDWPFWTAFRELYCNCIDEQGETYSGAPRLGHIAPGRTTIMVEGDEFHNIFANREEYVLSTNPAFRLLTVNLHLGESRSLYYRGVRVYELPKPTRFRYNVVDYMTLTEDRTVRSLHEAQINIIWSLASCDQPDVIREVLRQGPGTFEYDLDFNSTGLVVGETFRKVLAECYHSRHDLSDSARKLYARLNEVKRDKYAPVEPTTIERMQLDRAGNICRMLGHNPDLYEIVLVESLGAGMLGEYREGRVFISRRAMSMGTKMVAGTLYEELVHARDGLIDETRSMQNHLIDELMTVVERHVLKEPI